MLQYLWINDSAPVLSQLPNYFKYATFIMNPLIQMPDGWTRNNRRNQYEHLYPSHEEILKYGKPISWTSIIEKTTLSSLEEVVIALKTSITALKREYAREDLSKVLNQHLLEDQYFPSEDKISEFILNDLLKVLSSNGARQIYYSDPIFDQEGVLSIFDTSAFELCELAPKEIIITDEKYEFAFMSVYDSFTTLFLSRNDPREIIESMGWVAKVCERNTYINWYLTN